MLIRVTRAGLNFADTHTRTNSYVQKATLPLVPGGEVAGVREDTGERVVALVGAGGYAEYAVRARGARVPDPGRARRRHGAGDDHPGDDRLAPVPHVRRASRPGESVVVHGAAGGVGSLAVQLGRPLGAGRVIATASSEEKRALALELGADAARRSRRPRG